MPNKKVGMAELNLENIKKYMSRIHSGKEYKLYEFETFYSVVFTGEKNRLMQPVLFNKKGAFRMNKVFGQMPKEKGKLIFESGGKDNGKK